MVVPHTLSHEKKILRERMREERLSRGVDPEAEARLATNLFQALVQYPHGRIGCVWPLAGEADLRPLCHRLHQAGREVLLPETTQVGQALIFRAWHPRALMMQGRYGTMHPDGPTMHPDILLVPLLAFDRRLHRLGYGGGYYDRTLAALRCIGIGFAFSWQEVAHVPDGVYDWPLDKVVTDRAIFAVSGQEREAQ